MLDKTVASDPFDIGFRRNVKLLIGEAKKSIKVATGEISAYDYLDLRDAAEEAAKRGIKVQVYSKDPDKKLVERLIYHKISVYKGEQELSEHFMIVDDKKVMISFKKENRIIPTPVGERNAKRSSRKEKVSEYIQTFDELLKGSTKVTANNIVMLEN